MRRHHENATLTWMAITLALALLLLGGAVALAGGGSGDGLPGFLLIGLGLIGFVGLPWALQSDARLGWTMWLGYLGLILVAHLFLFVLPAFHHARTGAVNIALPYLILMAFVGFTILSWQPSMQAYRAPLAVAFLILIAILLMWSGAALGLIQKKFAAFLVLSGPIGVLAALTSASFSDRVAVR